MSSPPGSPHGPFARLPLVRYPPITTVPTNELTLGQAIEDDSASDSDEEAIPVARRLSFEDSPARVRSRFPPAILGKALKVQITAEFSDTVKEFSLWEKLFTERGQDFSSFAGYLQSFEEHIDTFMFCHMAIFDNQIMEFRDARGSSDQEIEEAEGLFNEDMEVFKGHLAVFRDQIEMFVKQLWIVRAAWVGEETW